MRTVGIIGGLGPETTSEFYLKVISLCYKKDPTARPPMLMWSIPLEYQIEKDLITSAMGEERYLPYMIDAAKRLEQGGADFIVIPCNSVHIFINEVRASVHIPVLSIVDETVRLLESKGVKEVGLLATTTTVQKNLYQSQLQDKGITTHLLARSNQELIGTVINRLVLGQETEEDKAVLLSMIKDFTEKGISNILLACTDLQLLVPQIDNAEILDTMEILAQATAKEIMS